MRRLTDQQGFVLPSALLLLVITSAVVLTIFTAANGDLPLAKADQSRASALDAAQAGSAWYASKLAADPDVWLKCGNVPNPDGSSKPSIVSGTPWNGSGSEPRTFRKIPGAAGEYTVELLPANGASSCVQNNAATMIASNRIRIRSTGRVGGVKRSIITTFRRPSFLDYAYYTNYEVTDPSAIPNSTNLDECTRYYHGSPNRQGQGCNEINWITGDVIAGPVHTNDQLNICGTPTFGRTLDDAIEVVDPASTRSDCGSNGATMKGRLVTAKPISRPPDNQSLRDLTLPGYTFTSSTQFRFSPGANFEYRNYSTGLNWQTKALPANGLIYVVPGSGNCPDSLIYQRYDLANEYNCGNAYVSGTYDRSITVAAAKDIVIVDNLVHSGDAMMGLVANDFVRIFHPVNFSSSNSTTCDANNTNSTDSGYIVRSALPWKDPKIDAGILAVNHSFMVDNYPCGKASELGNLTIVGAIAQEFRGPVGTGQITSGYVKKYSYDDRFAYREPPNFLEPVRAAWILVRQNEQLPAT